MYLRQHYGITQEGLAEQLSVSRQTVSKWEAGTNYPEMDKLLQLCDLFHTSLDDLMRGSVHVVKENDTERYDEHMNRFDLSIAAGVACILVGVGLNALLEAFGWPDNLQTVALLSCIVIGVVILVVAVSTTANSSVATFHRAAVLLRHARSVRATLPDAHRRRRGSHPHRRHHANRPRTRQQ